MSNWSRLGLAGGLLVVAVLGIGVSTFPARADDDGFSLKAPPKIAMVIFDQRSDGGWSMAFYEALQQIEKDLGVEIDYTYDVDEAEAHITAAVERFIASGHNIIIGTGYNYSKPFVYLAKRHPDVAFLNGGGVTNGPNLQSFYGRADDSQYLCGMIAGAMSKTGHLGFVGAFDITSVNWAINGFTMGARQMNPKATTYVALTQTWADPNAEQTEATRLIDGGADVIGQNVDTPRPQIVAQRRGIYSTGHHRDLSEYAPKATLCSSVWKWERYLTPELKKIIAGHWKPNPDGATPSFKDGPSDIVINKALVPQKLIDRVMEERMAIINGKDIYAGPLYDNMGKLIVAKGVPLSNDELWSMKWHAEGVVMLPVTTP